VGLGLEKIEKLMIQGDQSHGCSQWLKFMQ